MSKLNQDFDVREFVPKSVFDEFGAVFCLRFVNPIMLKYATWLKAELGKKYACEVSIRINDWHYGGSFQNRAFRPPTSTVGKWTSAHKLAMGVDMDFKRKDTGAAIPIKEVFDFVIAHQKEVLAMGVTRLEDYRDTPTWLHSDCLYTAKTTIQIVRP